MVKGNSERLRRRTFTPDYQSRYGCELQSVGGRVRKCNDPFVWGRRFDLQEASSGSGNWRYSRERPTRAIYLRDGGFPEDEPIPSSTQPPSADQSRPVLEPIVARKPAVMANLLAGDSQDRPHIKIADEVTGASMSMRTPIGGIPIPAPLLEEAQYNHRMFFSG